MANAKKYFALLLLNWFVLCLYRDGSCSTVKSPDTERAFFGWFLGGGNMQSNFDEIRKEPYFLNKPSNFCTHFGAGFYIGNPDKFFVSIPFGLILPNNKTGNYLGYDISIGRSGNFWSAQAGYQLFRNSNRKLMKAMYIMAGISQTNFLFSSKATGAGVVNSDTSFYFEYSKVRTLGVSPEIIIELFNLKKTDDGFPTYPLTLKLGYHIQIRNPDWTTLESSMTVSERTGSLNGFYISLGINFWLKKKNYGTK